MKTSPLPKVWTAMTLPQCWHLKRRSFPGCSAPALAPLGPGPGLVHLQRTPGEVLAVEPGDRGERVRFARHFHEAEPPGRTGKQLAQQFDGFDFAECLEQLRELRFSHFGRKVAYKNIHLNS